MHYATNTTIAEKSFILNLLVKIPVFCQAIFPSAVDNPTLKFTANHLYFHLNTFHSEQMENLLNFLYTGQLYQFSIVLSKGP
jgi:hypothetical protein